MFEHVEQEWLRNVLNGDVSEASLCRALYYTRKHLEEEEEVSLAALEYCLDWLDDADLAWYEEGDMIWSLHSLRNVWRIR
jgi:hypothetical protein